MSDCYRVKTAHGYYYSTGGGRYGRFDGQKLWAEVMCKQHADELAGRLSDISVSLEATVEAYPGHAPCARCAREKTK